MHVKLYYTLGLECNDRIADAYKEASESFYIEILYIGLGALKLNEKLGAVALRHFAVFIKRKRCGRR